MKKVNLFIFLIIVIANISLNAQLLNSSFEEWDSQGSPLHWDTAWYPGIEKSITQSNDAQDGLSSARLEMLNVLGEPFSGNLQSIDTSNVFGHPINERYEALTGFRKFFPKGSAELLLVVSVYSSEFMILGTGGFSLQNEEANWTEFSVPIEYYFEGNAGSVNVSISIVDTFSSGFDPNTMGSVAFLDNLSFGNTTNVNENTDIMKVFSLNQNYPNPFNPSTTIKYSIPKQSNVTLKLFDVLGSEIATLINKELPQGSYELEFDGSELTSGIYFYKLQARNFIKTKKMILLK